MPSTIFFLPSWINFQNRLMRGLSTPLATRPAEGRRIIGAVGSVACLSYILGVGSFTPVEVFTQRPSFKVVTKAA